MSRKMKENEFEENQPCHWNYTRLKFATKINEATLISTDIEEISYSPMECVRSDFFQPKTISTRKLPTGLSTFKEGDVLLAKITPCFENGNVAVAKNLLNGYGVGSSELIPFTPKKIVDRFLMYLFRSNRFVETGKSTIRGVGGLRRITMDFIYGYAFYAPEIDEQNRIVAYLDKKCSQIDTLISNQQKQIEKLKKYKQSVITEVVTKGLNPDVEMKDSGFSWVSSIPKHWKVKKIKQVAKVKTGSTPASDNQDYFGGEINWYTPGDFSDNFISVSQRTITQEAVKAYSINLYPENTTLLIGIGGTTGKVALILEKGYSNQQITAIMTEDMNKKYLFYYMLSIQDYMKDNAQYTTLPIINNQYLSNIFIIEPDKKEQTEIVNYLDEKCNKIDSLIAIKQQKIEKLNQYKKSVIYEYVTGKKEA